MESKNELVILMKARPSILHYLFYFIFPCVIFLFGRWVHSSWLIFWVAELLILFWVVLTIFLNEYLVTNKSFLIRSVFTPAQKGVSVAIEEIKGIEIQPRLFFQRWFNTANVLIETDRPNGLSFKLNGLENPEGFKNFIYSLRRF
jgi:hypothetical protein